MFCKNCGKEINDEAVVCPNCGVATENMQKSSTSNVPAQRNTIAIVGFIFSFFSSIIGLILSIIGLTNAKKPEYNGDCKGLAIAGIVISCAGTVLYIILLATCGTALGCAAAAAGM